MASTLSDFLSSIVPYVIGSFVILGYIMYDSYFRVPSIEEMERKATKAIPLLNDDDENDQQKNNKIILWGFSSTKQKHRSHEYGVPDVSPYVSRVECFLRLAKIPYTKLQTKGLSENPRGKVPFAKIMNGTTTIMIDDSSKIIETIRTKFTDNNNIKIDDGLTKNQLTLGFFIQQTLFGEFYYILNYGAFQTKQGREAFMDEIDHDQSIPNFIKPLLTRFVMKSQCFNLYAAGPGRWSRSDVDIKARYTMEMFGNMLGSKSYILGTSHPTSYDCDVYAFLGRAFYDIPHRNFEWVIEAKQAYPNLVQYTERMRDILFPEIVKKNDDDDDDYKKKQ